jgi:hypothetical protein
MAKYFLHFPKFKVIAPVGAILLLIVFSGLHLCGFKIAKQATYLNQLCQV